MANHYEGDTDFIGTVTINGVEVSASVAAATLAAVAVAALVGATSASSGVVGGGSGTTILKATAQSAPNLTVQVAAGTCFIAGVFTGIATATASLTGFAAPATNPRKDIVQISNAGVISRKAGTEGASPTAPTVDAGNLKLAEVYNRVGQTSVKNTDDATNGYITDSRVFL